MKTHQLGAFTILTISLLAGCASYDKRDYKGLRVEPANTRLGSVISHFPRCPSQPLTAEQAEGYKVLPIIAGAAITAGVGLAINAVDKALEENKKGLTGQFIAAGVHGKAAVVDRSCLIITRGLFGDLSEDLRSLPDHLTFEHLSKLNLAHYPAFYLELLVKRGKDGKAVELVPVYLSYAASSARTYGSGRKDVSLVVAMSDAAPKASGTLEEEKAFAIFRHDFGRLVIGKSYKLETLVGTAASQPESAQLSQDVFNISALITESEDPGIAREALVKTFTENKGALQSALEEAIKNAVGVKANK